MKILLLLLLLATVPARAQTPATTAAPAPTNAPTGVDALDAKNGFRGYTFGTPIANLSLLKPKPRTKDTYLAPEESLTIGDVKLRTLEFTSYDNRLSGVVFTTIGGQNPAKLLEILTAQYGAPKDAGYRTKAWVGNVVTMYFIEGGTQDYPFCGVQMSNNALVAQEKADREAVAKKAAGDL